MRRRLTLARETLTELANEDLAFAGAQQALPTFPLGGCAQDLSDRVRACDSILRPCISGTCTL